MSFFGKIDFNRLSETEKVLYHYMSSNIEKIPYMRIREVARPVRELKRFEKVSVKANGIYQGSFEITIDDLAYVHSDLTRFTDPGKFELYLGFDSNAPKLGEWEYQG